MYPQCEIDTILARHINGVNFKFGERKVHSIVDSWPRMLANECKAIAPSCHWLKMLKEADLPKREIAWLDAVAWFRGYTQGWSAIPVQSDVVSLVVAGSLARLRAVRVIPRDR